MSADKISVANITEEFPIAFLTIHLIFVCVPTSTLQTPHSTLYLVSPQNVPQLK